MKLEDFDFHLPTGAAVRAPLPERDGGKLMVVRRDGGTIEHRLVRDLPGLLQGRVCYGNDTRVSRCRVEVLLPPKGVVTDCILTEQLAPLRWKAFSKVPKFYSPKDVLQVVGGPAFRVAERDPDDHSKAVLEFEAPVDLEACGSYPLPPWATRPAEPVDWARYEPLYAAVPGSRARATAGSCLSQELLDALKPRLLTLHVALESYDGVSEAMLREGRAHVERYELRDVPPAGAVAIGSTALRTLEAYGRTGQLAGKTDLFLAPGHEFTVAGGLLTNFHFPMESVLVMTCAFGGTDLVLRAYKEAAEKGYRFGDWGDSMLIL